MYGPKEVYTLQYGERIARLRKESGLPQEELSLKISISRVLFPTTKKTARISSLYSRKSNPCPPGNVKKIIRIIKALEDEKKEG
jgi:transcriptional regulator with XRE-family HTH domain